MIVLDPQLATVGFGIFCANDDCAGVIIYRRGLTKSEFLALYDGNGMDWNPMNGDMPFTQPDLESRSSFHRPACSFRRAHIAAASIPTC